MKRIIRNKTTFVRHTTFMLLVGALFAQPVLADGDRVAELERRIAELESMVETLLDQRGAGSAQAEASARQAAAEAQQASAEAAEARERIEELDRKVEPMITEASEKADKPMFSYGGYIKADFMVSDFDDGEVSGDSIGRDFYVPAIVPIGDKGSTSFDAHAKQTRFNLGTSHQIGEHTLESFVELDFLTTPGGTERTTNNFSPRLRHAFVKWNNWLVGQTWNTFMDVATLPESVDFIGPTSGTTFGRTPMVRYTNGGLAIALENPESSITPVGGGRIEADDNKLPELAARYTWSGDWGHFQLGGLLRQLEIDDNATGLDATETGWGVSLSGKFMLGRDDIRYMVHAGDGLGRQVALNFVNGAALDATGSLDAISTVGGFVAYRHWWSQKWRSNVAFGILEADNPNFTGEDANKSTWNAQVNLFYSPVPPLSFGVEFLTAEREIESGAKGQLNRFQFTTKYAF
ncbi:MAG: porin [Wenzhouxiangellaceae bacterium]|nr:porin [Wenzhouxiangellaceae bacterium]MBS3747476.1 porin [Wenzhouxiangellaceae bacterium]MBS3824507.1 porin [Wenzhouxiangellaceae bacterium]